MNKYPYVILSTAMSLDGYIDDATENRLRISNKKDFERVDILRSRVDAILVGANTIRRDDPKFISKTSQDSSSLVKVTITSSGQISDSSAFFTTGDSKKFVYTTTKGIGVLNKKNLPKDVTIITAGNGSVDLHFVLRDLYNRGIKCLMVEGGSSILTQFLQAGLVNELHLAIAGFFVGESNAPHFVKEGEFPFDATHRMHLESVEKLDDIAVLVYKI